MLTQKSVWTVLGGTMMFVLLLMNWAVADELLESLAKPKSFRAARISSSDPFGGNGDYRSIKPGDTLTLAEIQGAGSITHFWVTIATEDQQHPRKLVIRMYWDGESDPSVEAPIGDFFGQGHGMYYQYCSAPIQIGMKNGLNCFWDMPFSKSAKITVTNESSVSVDAFFYYVDYGMLPGSQDNPLRFHAQYRQEYPCVPLEDYVLLDAKGKGHYVGCNLSVELNSDGWWGEGDDKIYIDGETEPSMKGTGSEDYFCGAWGFQGTFDNPYFGAPLRTEGGEKVSSLCNVYRYHIADPIPFEKSIRVTIEHGSLSTQRNNYSSVAYWYQTEPHVKFPAMAKVEERLPRYIPPVRDAKTKALIEEIFTDFGQSPTSPDNLKKRYLNLELVLGDATVFIGREKLSQILPFPTIMKMKENMEAGNAEEAGRLMDEVMSIFDKAYREQL